MLRDGAQNISMLCTKMIQYPFSWLIHKTRKEWSSQIITNSDNATFVLGVPIVHP